MFTEKHIPTFLTQKTLDDYLEKAWYRLGQLIFTTHFMFVEGQLFSPIWLRLPLQGYTFRKSLRKILKRNDPIFKTFIRPYEITDEHRALYEIYRENFKGRISVTLEAYLQDGKNTNIFNSYEVAIYDGDVLVASSVFDVGQKSLASIMGMYHPDYAKNSLGIYTMLQEMRYGLERDFDYYYPGYFVPGRPRFDYKLRIGKKAEVQYFSLKERNWKSMVTYSNEEVPIIKLVEKLGQVRLFLEEQGIPCQLLFCPESDSSQSSFLQPDLLESPIFLHCFLQDDENLRYIIIYDLWKEKYVFFELTRTIHSINFFGNEQIKLIADEETLFKEEVTRRVILESEYAWRVAKEIIGKDFIKLNVGQQP